MYSKIYEKHTRCALLLLNKEKITKGSHKFWIAKSCACTANVSFLQELPVTCDKKKGF